MDTNKDIENDDNFETIHRTIVIKGKTFNCTIKINSPSEAALQALADEICKTAIARQKTLDILP